VTTEVLRPEEALQYLSEVRVEFDRSWWLGAGGTATLERIVAAGDIGDPLVPWYRNNDGAWVQDVDPSACPLTLSEARSLVEAAIPGDRWTIELEVVRRLIDNFRSNGIRRFVLPIYQFDYRSAAKRILLDGNHRAIALMISEMPFFEGFLMVMRGPNEVGVLRDLRHWQER
jgi:hypothetical protein